MLFLSIFGADDINKFVYHFTFVFVFVDVVVFGAVIGYSGDDISKFLWMVRIGESDL